MLLHPKYSSLNILLKAYFLKIWKGKSNTYAIRYVEILN